LQLWAARSGKCDGCSKKVQTGEQVMDCRRCNWYLCSVCCPQVKSQETTLWGAISSLPFYVLDDMSEMATDIETFVTASFDPEKDVDGQVKSADQKPEPPVSPRQKAESTQVVTEFCEKYPAMRVVPNEADLDVFWAKCSVLHARPIADAIYDQLSFSGGDNDWQPRLRALYALEHLHLKGGMGRDITRIVLHTAKGLLQHLTEVEKCSAKATQVIATLKGAKPGEDAALPEKAAAQSAAAKASQAPASAGSKAAPKPKATPPPKPQDLLDMAAPAVAAPAKAAGAGAKDLLDLPLEAPPVNVATGPRGVNDLLDLTATSSAPVFDAPFDPSAVLVKPLMPAAAAPAVPSAMMTVGAAPGAPSTARLADLYALYPQSGAPGMMQSAPMGSKDMFGLPMGAAAVPPATRGMGPAAAVPSTRGPMLGAVEPGWPMGQAPKMAVGTTPGALNASAPSDPAADASPKERGLESLLSDAVAGLGNLGAAPSAPQPSRQAGGMHRVLAAH